MLYEIISPDAFLRPFIDDYGTLSAIYAVVRKAYTKTVYVDRDFQRRPTSWSASRSEPTVSAPVTESSRSTPTRSS
jgi:hypothetical protein